MDYNCTSISDPFDNSTCLYNQTKGDFIDRGSNMLVFLFFLWALIQFYKMVLWSPYKKIKHSISRI